MPKEDKLKEVRDPVEQLSPDDSKGRLMSLSEMPADEFFAYFDMLTELLAKAGEKYGYGIHPTAAKVLVEDPTMSEVEFWRKLDEYWDGLDEATKNRIREKEPDPLICLPIESRQKKS